MVNHVQGVVSFYLNLVVYINMKLTQRLRLLEHFFILQQCFSSQFLMSCRFLYCSTCIWVFIRNNDNVKIYTRCLALSQPSLFLKWSRSITLESLYLCLFEVNSTKQTWNKCVLLIGCENICYLSFSVYAVIKCTKLLHCC